MQLDNEMESSQTIQETIRGTYPTTSSFRPHHARLHIIRQSRQVMDFDKVTQSKERPNANRFYQENGFGTAVILQFIVGIVDVETGELWNCNIRVKRRKLIIECGIFSIEVRISPNGLVCFPTTDIKQNQLPNYLSNVKCVLPVEEDEPLTYAVGIKLYQNDFGVKKLLDSVKYTVSTHERGRDMYDYQEGRGIMEVERPQLKIKMTGILAEEIGRQLIMLFQKLGDNGCYEQFYLEQQKLLNGLEKLEEKFGKDYFKDLELSIKLEESILLFGRHLMVDCVRTAKEVIDHVKARNVPNGPFLMAKAHYIISAVYRQRGDFDKAQEHMEYSTELLESVVVSEETAVNQYNWAALLSEKAAKSSLTSAEQNDAEFRFENCLLHWNHQKQNCTNRCPMRTQIRNINFNLRTSRQSFPDESKPVSEEGLARAEKAIQYVEQHLLKTCSKRHKVTFDIARSDYCIRKAQMNGSLYTHDLKKQYAKKAYSILEKALETAKNLKLESEEEGIQDRLQNIDSLFHSCKEENQCHSERAKEPSRNEAVEHDASSMEDLLKVLANISMELKEDHEIKPEMEPSADRVMSEEGGA